MPKKATHIIHRWESEDRERLYRASDGMHLAEYCMDTALIGETKRESNMYMFLPTEGPNHYSHSYLVKVANDDCKALGIEGEAVIDLQQQEGLVIRPVNAENDLRFNSGTPMRKIGGKYVNGKLSAN